MICMVRAEKKRSLSDCKRHHFSGNNRGETKECKEANVKAKVHLESLGWG